MANKRRKGYTGLVRCTVFVIGKDGNEHEQFLDASSVFDAADKGINHFCIAWWWNRDATIRVQAGDRREWYVTAERVRRWRENHR